VLLSQLMSPLLQVVELERRLAAAAGTLHQSLQAEGVSSSAAKSCNASAEAADAAAQQQAEATAAEAAESAQAANEAALVRLDGDMAVEKRTLRAAMDARDAAQQELRQAERRYQRCAAPQWQRGPRLKHAATGAAIDSPGNGTRRQLQVTLRL
jgi:hypothetical protein